MKTYILLASMAICTAGFSQDKNDAVKRAEDVNEKKSEKGMVNSTDAEFLVTAADARMMGTMEGTLATERGTTIAIKEYGNTMINDQKAMLKEIKELAASRNITIPPAISNEKKDGRNDLAELSGERFDKKFLKMMIIDHKRDLKKFKKAVKSNDEEISEFAELYIPVIQSHLARAKSLKKEA